MAAPRPTQANGPRPPRPPQREPPLPPVPPHQPPPPPPPPPSSSSTHAPRLIPRKPVPPPPRPADPNLVDASLLPTDLVPTAAAPLAPPPPPPPSHPPFVQSYRPHNTSRSHSHGRSMSHPFPNTFPSRKKPGPQKEQDDFDSDSDSDAEMLGLGPGSKSKGPVQHVGPSHTKTMVDNDSVSGNCMTCGALSRWPKGLTVFKCTLCVTINDLVDLRSVAEGPNGAGHRSEGPSSSGPILPGPRGPISLELTRRLARTALRSYLSTALGLRRPSVDSKGRGSMEQFRPHAVPARDDGGPARVANGEEYEGRTPSIDISNQETMDGERPSYFNFSRPGSTQRSQSSSYPETRPDVRLVPPSPNEHHVKCHDPDGKRLFKPLEDYVINCFSSPMHCVNASFMQRTPRKMSRRGTQPVARRPSDRRPPDRRPSEPRRETAPAPASGPIQASSPALAPSSHDAMLPELDHKLLLLGDVAENGMWWTGQKKGTAPARTPSHREEHSIVSSRSPNIEWAEVDAWYQTVVNAGEHWKQVYEDLVATGPSTPPTDADLRQIESHVLEAQEHLRKTLLKVTEALLKRPGRPITNPEDLRFLLIVSANPLLHASHHSFSGSFAKMQNGSEAGMNAIGPSRPNGPVSGQHSLIVKRILGLLSNTPTDCHNHLISWFSRLPEFRFIQLKDFAGGFLAYRLLRQNEKKWETKVDFTAGLIPQLGAGRSPASLHHAIGHPSRNRSKKAAKEPPKKIVYHDDWQTKAAARVMGLLFAANHNNYRRNTVPTTILSHDEVSNSNSARDQVQARGQVVPTSDFYNSLLDDSDLLADFDAWEQKKSKFSFCQFPFLLSIWAKIQILEHDAKRQMHNRARDAFFDSIMSRRNVEQYLTLSVRRDCLVEDSLKSVSEVIGGGGEDIKKGLRIAFQGEEGVDAGGLKKEWFLLLVREVFNPDHGMFVYDEDSQYCYFNPNSFETSDQYFLVGVVFGLAIYNSIILDVSFPPFAFRKLLTAAPPPAPGLSIQHRPAMTYTLDDLAEFRPRLAKGLRQLLEYDPDIVSGLCLEFAVDIDKYGTTERVPLCHGGESRAVTGANRREYVDLYVKYLLDTAVSRQFEPFKRGFFTVCGGNALSLFRPEEIELLVRGSDEPLDVRALRVSAEYENWGPEKTPQGHPLPPPDQTEPTLRWFWETFEKANVKDQRSLLAFITGSDRIPAMGAASLTIRISCLGEDTGRYPTARTCFNSLQLWRYRSREQLERLLWGAVHESEGFGLK